MQTSNADFESPLYVPHQTPSSGALLTTNRPSPSEGNSVPAPPPHWEGNSEIQGYLTYEASPPKSHTVGVGLCLGPYGGPREGGECFL